MLQNILTSDGYPFELQVVAVLKVFFFVSFCFVVTLVACGIGYLLLRSTCSGYKTFVSMVSWGSLGNHCNHLKRSISTQSREMSEAVSAAINTLSICFLACVLVALCCFPLIHYGTTLKGFGAIVFAGLLLGILVAIGTIVHGFMTRVKCMHVVGRAALCVACGPVAMVLFLSFLIALSYD